MKAHEFCMIPLAYLPPIVVMNAVSCAGAIKLHPTHTYNNGFTRQDW